MHMCDAGLSSSHVYSVVSLLVYVPQNPGTSHQAYENHVIFTEVEKWLEEYFVSLYKRTSRVPSKKHHRSYISAMSQAVATNTEYFEKVKYPSIMMDTSISISIAIAIV